jgi:hypothetical protein
MIISLWGAFCPGGFCPVPNIYIIFYRLLCQMGTTDDVYNIQNNYCTYTLQQKNYFDSKTICFTGVISPYGG